MELAIHATGNYPEWWQGHRFDRAIRSWAAGNSSETTRDNPQRQLLGYTPELWGTGSLPASSIIDVKRAKGVTDAADLITVRHRTGGISTIKFKSYDQGREKWQGVPIDLVWFDEEPPIDIYTEGTTRTNATQGIAYITATPLLGMTEVVRMFYPEPVDRMKGLITMTIYDAGHYTPEQIQEIIDKTPLHEVEARTKGKPMLGEGLVFPIAQSEISVEPFEIPGHWARIIGLDFGWDHPTAAVSAAWDKDADTFYITAAYKQSREVIPIHTSAIKPWGPYPVAWPHDGYKHDSSSGEQIATIYRQHGLKMLPEHATNLVGGFGVEAPVQEILEAMLAGRFKIFSHLGVLFDELTQYHRKNGQIVKLYDDTISAMRYAWMMRRYAKVALRKPAAKVIGMDYSPFGLN
jgi:phage terminase large subunit-like protein